MEVVTSLSLRALVAASWLFHTSCVWKVCRATSGLSLLTRQNSVTYPKSRCRLTRTTEPCPWTTEPRPWTTESCPWTSGPCPWTTESCPWHVRSGDRPKSGAQWAPRRACSHGGVQTRAGSCTALVPLHQVLHPLSMLFLRQRGLFHRLRRHRRRHRCLPAAAARRATGSGVRG